MQSRILQTLSIRRFATERTLSNRQPNQIKQLRESLLKGDAKAASQLYADLRKDPSTLLAVQRHEFRDLLCLSSFSEQEKVIKDMESLHMPIQVQEYNLLASKGAKMWKRDTVNSFLEKMRANKIQPNYTTYKHLVEGSLAQDDVATAEQLIAFDLVRDKVKPSLEEQAHLFGIVAEGNVKRGKMDALKRL
jgi:hypothetical protein